MRFTLDAGFRGVLGALAGDSEFLTWRGQDVSPLVHGIDRQIRMGYDNNRATFLLFSVFQLARAPPASQRGSGLRV